VKSLALAALLALAGTLVPSFAVAQVSVQTRAAGRPFEVGQAFQLEVNAMGSGQETPDDPRLPVPPGFEVQGPSLGTRTQVSVMNGRMTQQTGISATWTVVGSRPGTFKLGPPSVRVGNRRETGNVIVVEIVPKGTLPRSQGGRPSIDPFGMFDPFGTGSGFPPGFFGQDPRLLEPDEPPPVPEELRVAEAPDPVAFVRAVVSPKRPVVGEQVTLRIYAYGSRGTFRESSPTEASRADFLSYSVVEGLPGEDFVRVPIGDTTFYAVKIRELALFPLRSGKLAIGPMTMTFDGPRYRNRVPIVRSSAAIELDVAEPPLDGRPPGYKLGDVGELTLEAGVDPKKITAGDAVSVIAKLEGTGNIPLSLLLPQKRGVDWLDPTLTEKIGPEGSVIKGYRTFAYVVKAHEPGQVDLGELTLPYWSPKRRAYQTLRVALGTIEVTANPNAVKPSTNPADDARDKALALTPRRSPSPFSRHAATFTDDDRFFFALFGLPALVALLAAALHAGSEFKRRMADAKAGPDRLAQEALRVAEQAAGRDEVATTAAAVERALFLAIEAATGLRGRALLKDELGRALVEAGLPEETCRRTLDLLDGCESARFTGKSAGLPPPKLLLAARERVTELLRHRRTRRRLAA